MKLYMHPVSTASRPVRLLIAEKQLPVTEQLVDLMKGEHHQEPYATLNPSKMVPMLEDGDLRLTESAAILRYLGSKFALPEYPSDLRARAKVDEALDWFNTQFYRDFAYGVVYPQIFPNHKRPSADLQQGVIAWGTERARGWFGVLDRHWLGASKPFLTGEQITIADYFGACIVTAGETIRCDLAAFPNVDRWIGNMKQLDTWSTVNEALHGFTQYLSDQPFQAL